MPTSSTPNLTERVTAELAAGGDPRAVVLSLKSEINHALSVGLKLSSLWRQLHKEHTFRAGYDRFRRLVRELAEPRRNKPSNSRGNARGGASPAPVPGFNYSPTSNPQDLF